MSNFDCGKPSLDDWLRKYAWQNQQSQTSVTYVVLQDGDVVAYYSLSTGSVSPTDATARTSKVIGKYPVPILLLARLAVDRKFHGKGLGHSLLQDALIRSVSVADEVGIRAVVVDALDDSAKRFYIRYGFEESPMDSMRLMLLMKDIKMTLGL